MITDNNCQQDKIYRQMYSEGSRQNSERPKQDRVRTSEGECIRCHIKGSCECHELRLTIVMRHSSHFYIFLQILVVEIKK